MGAKWPWIVAGLGLLITVGMGVAAGIWAANGGLDRLMEVMGEEESERRDIARLSRRLKLPIPIEANKVAQASAVYIQDGVLWARPFAAAQAKPVVSDPSTLGYSRVCCMVGPDRLGRVVGFGFLDDGSGEVFQIDLGAGEFLPLVKQEDSKDDVGYWQAQKGDLTAVWLPDKASSAALIPVGKVQLFDGSGRLVKKLGVPTAQRIVLSNDGKTLFAIVPRSRAYAEWHKERKGPAPQKTGTPETEMIARIDIADESVTEISPGYDFMISWDEKVLLADLEDDSKFLTLAGRDGKEIPWSENILWTTDIGHQDLLLGLHVPWPDEARVARRTCEDEYGSIAAIEPSTSKVKILDTICYMAGRGPELSFGPWSGEVKAVKGR